MTQSTQMRPRIHAPQSELVPVAMVRLMFTLVALCLVLVGVSVWTGRPMESTPPDSAIIREKMLFLHGEMSGAATVLDANGTVVADLSAEEGGFIAGMYRVLLRERNKAQVPVDGPVRVVQTQNGRLAIFDPSTGWSADLMGFGADNSAAFARLLK